MEENENVIQNNNNNVVSVNNKDNTNDIDIRIDKYKNEFTSIELIPA